MAKEKSQRHIAIDELATFCKRKGFVYPAGEIYGGLAGFWDFGPLGVELINNIKREWWKYHVNQRQDVVGIDGSIITNPKVWEASGHLDSFSDLMLTTKKSKKTVRADQFIEDQLGIPGDGLTASEINALIKKHKLTLKGEDFEEITDFNLMFPVSIGASKESMTVSYLRGETAQTIFPNFRIVQDNARLQLPFGIAQTGKAFRNEIAPREFLFRVREFEQMEIEYFIAPGMNCPYIDEIKGTSIEVLTEEMQDKKQKPKSMNVFDAWKKKVMKTDWHAYWLATEYNWFVSLGADPGHFRARQHLTKEKSHYAVDTWDLEYKFPMGWRELQGFANRGTFDLEQHQKHSKKSMEIFDEGSKKKVLPEVVCEPSLGLGRAFIVFMLDAYRMDNERNNVVLSLSPKLAPYKAAVLPLASKGETAEMGYEIYRDLIEEFNVLYDKSGSLGRRYSRNDEIGTPFCITVDNDTGKDKTVTIRNRDNTKQIRVSTIGLRDLVRKLINDEISFDDAGDAVETRVK